MKTEKIKTIIYSIDSLKNIRFESTSIYELSIASINNKTIQISRLENTKNISNELNEAIKPIIDKYISELINSLKDAVLVL